MNIFADLTDLLKGTRARIIIERPDKLTEKEMETALTQCPETHAIYRAFMQLLYQALDEAHVNAEEDLTQPRALEAHTGGAKYVRGILENVLTRRQRAAERRQPKPESGNRIPES